MRSPQYSDIADEQEMILFGGLNASDSGFGGSSNVLHPDDAAILQVNFLKVVLEHPPPPPPCTRKFTSQNNFGSKDTSMQISNYRCLHEVFTFFLQNFQFSGY